MTPGLASIPGLGAAPLAVPVAQGAQGASERLAPALNAMGSAVMRFSDAKPGDTGAAGEAGRSLEASMTGERLAAPSQMANAKAVLGRIAEVDKGIIGQVEMKRPSRSLALGEHVPEGVLAWATVTAKAFGRVTGRAISASRERRIACRATSWGPKSAGGSWTGARPWCCSRARLHFVFARRRNQPHAAKDAVGPREAMAEGR